jgi:hypothetical protein
VLNTGAESIETLLPLPQTLKEKQALLDLYTKKTLPVSQGSVHIKLNAFEGAILE